MLRLRLFLDTGCAADPRRRRQRQRRRAPGAGLAPRAARHLPVFTL